MDIALVTTWNVPCGIATYSAALAKALQANGHRVTILSEQDMERPLNQQGTVTCWRRGSSLTPLVQTVLSSPVKPDVVHFQHEYGLFPNTKELIKAVNALLSAHIRVVITLHTVTGKERWLSELYGNHEIVVHTAEGMAALGWEAEPIYIPHGCIQGLPPKPELEDHDIPLKILVPGFVNASKATEEVVRAFVELPHSNCDMIVAGLCRDPGYAEKLERIVDFSGGRVDLQLRYHSDEEIYRLFYDSDIVVLGRSVTTPYSASGQMALAFSFGKPVLAQNSNIHLDHGGAAMLYSTFEELQHWMDSLITDRRLRMVMTNRSLQVAANRSMEFVAELHEGVYRED